MKSMRIFFAVLLWSVTFTIASANVRMNEIAWMGTTVSGTDEWIELFNEGDTPVDLSGWSIVALDGSPSITLSGALAPLGYFLIERTDDTTVPDIPADQVAPFGSGLSNTGETLYLKDATGTVIDTVVGGTGWANIGGDNSTKETAQYTRSGWVTGVPTPRTANVTHGEVITASTTAAPSDIASSKDAGAEVSSGGIVNIPSTPTYPRKEISVALGDVKNALVGIPMNFFGTAYGLYDEPLPHATFRWNFGDGALGEGKEVSHVYHFPGEYSVVLEVFWGSEHKTIRTSVNITEPLVRISKTVSGSNGFIELTNRSEHEVDISLWQLRVKKGASFTIPRNTFISAGQSVRFPNIVTGSALFDDGLDLVYPDGSIVASFGGVTTSTSTQKAENLSLSSLHTVMLASVTKSAHKENIPEIVDDASSSAVLWQGNKGSVVASVGSISEKFSNNMTAIFSVLFLALLLLAGLMISRANEEHSIATQYAIIEDIIESKDDLVKD